MREWAGPRYDPERFDLRVVNEILKILRVQRRKRER